MRRLCPGPAPWAHRHTVPPVRTRARSRKRPGRIRGEASGNEHVEPNQREPSAEEVSSPQFRNLGDAAAAKSEHRLDEGLEFLVRGASLIAAKPRLCNHHSHATGYSPPPVSFWRPLPGILVRQNGTPFLSLQNAADVGSCCVFVRVLSRHPSSHSRAPALGVWAARSSAAKVRNRRRLQDSQLLQRWVSISHTSLTLEPTVVIGLKRPAACGHLHPFCSSKPILCTGQNWLQPAAPS